MIRAADQRASDAEREEVVERLRIAAGEGRIGHDELDERLSRALSAKTYRQLHATVDDIPRDRGGSNRRVPQAQRTVAGWTVKAVRNEPWLLVFMLPVLVITLTLAAIGMMVWFVFIVAVLALGRPHRGPAHQLGRRRRPGQMGRGPGTQGGIAGSGWRWI
jgi:Domain of unknown function (DUF1707)